MERLVYLLFTILAPTMSVPDVKTVSSGNNAFTSKFYNILSKGDGNIFFSPLSAHAVLAMAYQGAGGDTANHFKSALNVANKELTASGYNSILRSLNKIKNVTLHLANKIFVMKDFELKESFVKVLSQQFLSETDPVDFGDSGKTAGIINSWVEQKTNSKIKNLISPDDLNTLTRLVLVNAVYFKGNWANKFNPEFTATEPFYLNDKDKVDCQMMHTTDRFSFREDEELNAKVLELPYSNKDISMVIVLPNERDGIKELESKLVNVNLSTLTSDMWEMEVNVSLPKFKIETTMDLKAVLKKMDLGVIFDMEKADFSGIAKNGEKLYVSKVIQKAFIEVNEEGAEAAAATGALMMMRCMPSLPEAFTADHPFLIYLKQKTETCGVASLCKKKKDESQGKEKKKGEKGKRIDKETKDESDLIIFTGRIARPQY